MQLPSSGQAGVVILHGVAALPAHWDEAPVAVAVGECHPVLAKHPWPQRIHLPHTLLSSVLFAQGPAQDWWVGGMGAGQGEEGEEQEGNRRGTGARPTLIMNV